MLSDALCAFYSSFINGFHIFEIMSMWIVLGTILIICNPLVYIWYIFTWHTKVTNTKRIVCILRHHSTKCFLDFRKKSVEFHNLISKGVCGIQELSVELMNYFVLPHFNTVWWFLQWDLHFFLFTISPESNNFLIFIDLSSLILTL